jgi:hypothetical protein
MIENIVSIQPRRTLDIVDISIDAVMLFFMLISNIIDTPTLTLLDLRLSPLFPNSN